MVLSFPLLLYIAVVVFQRNDAFVINATWHQLGSSIDGQVDNELSGYSVSLSSGGTILAVGSPSDIIRVHEYNGTAWHQLGSDITGPTGDSLGLTMSLSNDGTRLAAGAPYHDSSILNVGCVQVYEYNETIWQQLGNSIEGEKSGDKLGWSVSLSGGGSRVAVGTPYNDDGGSSAGLARVLEYNGSAWNQIGNAIYGAGDQDMLGSSVSLSDDGDILAAGAPNLDSGCVRVYKYDGAQWQQLGSDILGVTDGDYTGISISLSSDGSRVAVGAPRHDGNGDKAGLVRILEYNGTSWEQVGNDIHGEAANANSGYSVSLSGDGNMVAVGAPYLDSGYARLYTYDVTEWLQIGNKITGETTGDQSGLSVSISDDGSILAVGEPLHINGRVRCFDLLTQTPTLSPSVAPTQAPTSFPSVSPTAAPTGPPSAAPSNAPTWPPSLQPTAAPTLFPSMSPTAVPTLFPSMAPSSTPTASPLTPTGDPTSSPSVTPTTAPISFPSVSPTAAPTALPSAAPSNAPTWPPSLEPTAAPTLFPSMAPSSTPTASPVTPTGAPTSSPSVTPTGAPISSPSVTPTTAPISFPSVTPTVAPSFLPSVSPSVSPTTFPSVSPTTVLTEDPTSALSTLLSVTAIATPEINSTQWAWYQWTLVILGVSALTVGCCALCVFLNKKRVVHDHDYKEPSEQQQSDSDTEAQEQGSQSDSDEQVLINEPHQE